MNIINYASKNINTFDVVPFNEVDSLLLSELCYLKFNKIFDVNSNQKITINELNNYMDFDKLFITNNPKLDKKLLKELIKSPRYKNVEIKYHIDIYDEHTQFSATTFIINNDLTYIAFRGTDNTIVGWNEDFDMLFDSPINAQIKAVEYINEIIPKLDSNIYIGGHSKGGNLAIYSAIKTKYQDKIDKVFAHDSPAFPKYILDSDEYKNIKKKISKTIPKASIIGIVLETDTNYKIIKGNGIGFKQHNPFYWVVKENDFIYLNKITNAANFKQKKMTTWLANMTKEDRKIFVNTLFEVLKSSERKHIKSIAKNWKQTIPLIVNKTKNLDEKTKKDFIKIISELVKIIFKNQH